MEASVLRQSAAILVGLLLIGATERTLTAQTDSGTYIMRSDVEATTAEGLKRLQESGRSISDLMIRHVDVGEENLGDKRTALHAAKTAVDQPSNSHRSRVSGAESRCD